MDDVKSFLISLLANIATDLAKKGISALKGSMSHYEDVEAIRNATGIIEVEVANGTISLEGAKLEAFNSICCDHGSGHLNITRTELQAPILQTGGLDPDASGSTVITESILKTSGTLFSIGVGCTGTITGNSVIRQS